jgi:Tfp pilus assembly protein PilF
MFRRNGIIFVIVFCVGCAVVEAPPSFEASQRGLKLVDQGTLLLRSGELEKAEAAFLVAYELARLPAAVDGLGCVAFLRGDMVVAEQRFVEAYQADEGYNNALGNLALVYEATGRKEDATRLYARAVRENGDNFRIRGNFGAFLADSGNRQEAKQELLKAASIASHPLIEENLKRVEN